MANIRDVAELAGVSISTVSRYLNKTAKLSDERAKKIEESIEKLQYKPNVLARGVLTKKTATLGVIIPSIANPFFPELMISIEEYAQSEGYKLLLFNVNGDKDTESKAINSLLENRVEGILVARTEYPELYSDLDVPIVAIENHIGDHIPLVISDNYKGGKLAFEKLFQSGCKNIIHLAGDTVFEPTVIRRKGFENAAAEKEMSITVLQTNRIEVTKNYQQLISVFEGLEHYDGISTYNDFTAAKVIQYLSNIGLHSKIGREIKLIGYDNITMSELLSPPLTTVSQEVVEMGKLSVLTVLNVINGVNVDTTQFVDVKLVNRETT